MKRYVFRRSVDPVPWGVVPRTSRLSSAGSRWFTALLVGGVLAGFALRVGVWRSPFGQYESDEAVWGLMARHLLDGEISAFYWGQGYGGTLEVALTAVPYWLFGSSWVVARLVPIVLTGLAAVLVWRVGRRTIGEPGATVAGVVFWVFPAYLVWKTTRAHGFYGSGLVLTVLALLLVLRLAERRSLPDAALLGLVLGLAWWQTAQIVAVALPALAWLTWRRASVWKDVWAAIPLALVGALPWIASNLRHDWWSFHIEARGVPPYVSRLRGYFSATFPMDVNLRLPFTSEWFAGKLLTGTLYLALLALAAVVGWRLRRTNVSLLISIAVAYPFIYAISSYTWLIDEPRYLVLLTPVVVLLLCLPVTTLPRGAVAIGLALALSVATFARLDVDRYRIQADGHLVPREFAPLIAELDRLGIDRVFGQYWIVYRLDFESRERIIAAETDTGTLAERRPGAVLPQLPDDTMRYPPYDAEVRKVRSPAWVFRAGSTRDRHWQALFRRVGYVRDETGGFAIYHRGRASTRS